MSRDVSRWVGVAPPILAGWWRRVGANIVDLVLTALISVFVILISHSHDLHRVLSRSGSSSTTVPHPGTLIVIVVALVVQCGYFTFFNGIGSGQTPGNRLLSIAIRDVEVGGEIGLRRGFSRVFVRIVLYGLFVVPGMVNDLSPLFSELHQSIADKVARSVVVRV